jgi:hypothetical protein
MNKLGAREIFRDGFPLMEHYFYEIGNWIDKNFPRLKLKIEETTKLSIY